MYFCCSSTILVAILLISASAVFHVRNVLLTVFEGLRCPTIRPVSMTRPRKVMCLRDGVRLTYAMHGGVGTAPQIPTEVTSQLWLVLQRPRHRPRPRPRHRPSITWSTLGQASAERHTKIPASARSILQASHCLEITPHGAIRIHEKDARQAGSLPVSPSPISTRASLPSDIIHQPHN